MRLIGAILLTIFAMNSYGQPTESKSKHLDEPPPGYEGFYPTVSGQPVPWNKNKVFIQVFDRFFITSKREAVNYLESYLGYLKSLKTCRRSSHVIKNEFADIVEEYKIGGWKGEFCRVSYSSSISRGDCKIHKIEIPVILDKRKVLTKFRGFEGLSKEEDGVYSRSCIFEFGNEEGGK